MKSCVFLVIAVIVSGFFAACQPQQEITATPTAIKTATHASAAAQDSAAPTQTPLPAAQPHAPVAPQPSAPPVALVNATLQACKALEQHLLEELGKAQTEVNRKKRAYDKAVEGYTSALDAPIQDNSTIQQRRDAQDTTEDAYKDAQTDYTDAAKKLAKARQQCGLPTQ